MPSSGAQPQPMDSDTSSSASSDDGEKCDGCKKKLVGAWCTPCAKKLLDPSLPLSERLASSGRGFQLMAGGRQGLLTFYLEGRGGSGCSLEARLYVMYPEEKEHEGGYGLGFHQWKGSIPIKKTQDAKRKAGATDQKLPAFKKLKNDEVMGELQPAKVQLELRSHPPHLANKGETLTVELTPEGLIKGHFLRPAYRSLLKSKGKLPREKLDSYYFTGYPESLGYSQRQVSDGVYRDTYRGKDVQQRTDTLHDTREVEEAERQRAKNEEEARNAVRKKAGLPFEFKVDYDDYGDARINAYEPANFDSGDEKAYRRDYLGEDDMDELAGADWSGRPGQQCRCCGRRSDNVGPRRGFCYRTSYCGGCTDLPKMNEEEAERKNLEFSCF